MDELEFVCNHYDKVIHLVYVRYFVRNHHNNLSSNYHLIFYDLLLILILIVDYQEEANHDNHVELYFDLDVQDWIHLKKSNHDCIPENLV
jgi:hypothetical protein